MTSTVRLMGNVQQNEAPGLHVSLCSTIEAKIVHQSEAPDYMINDIHSKTNDKYSTHSKANVWLHGKCSTPKWGS